MLAEKRGATIAEGLRWTVRPRTSTASCGVKSQSPAASALIRPAPRRTLDTPKLVAVALRASPIVAIPALGASRSSKAANEHAAGPAPEGPYNGFRTLV